MDNTGCALEEVDAHNVVPVWLTSSVREKAAFTIRPKIHSRLGQFLTNFPPMKPLPTNAWPASCTADPIDWDALQEEARHRGAEVPEVSWLVPGEDAGKDALAAFLQRRRLSLYAPKRNDPTVPEALSGLSPYLHFGFLSPQRAAFEAQKQRQHLKSDYSLDRAKRVASAVGRVSTNFWTNSSFGESSRKTSVTTSLATIPWKQRLLGPGRRCRSTLQTNESTCTRGRTPLFVYSMKK